ncbi:MAG: radical SAM protein [Bacteroidales bacterium]|nr:radical SAM protein [Candidatus Latescibacterota bacterium]
MTQDRQSALGRVLNHKGKQYFFDVHSSEILHIDEVLASLLPVIGSPDEESCLSSLRGLHGDEAVDSAIVEFHTARSKEGLFLAERPEVASNCDSCLKWDRYQLELSHLTITLTDQCNLRCRYCLHSSSCSWVRPHRDRSLSKDAAVKALRFFGDRCGDSPHPNVSFYGGEPLLEFDLIKALVAEADEHPDWPDIRFTIDTNATLITEEVAEFLIHKKIHLQVSLDGPAATHDRFRVTRNGGPTHEAVLQGLRTVLELDAEAASRISFVATITPPYDFLTVAKYFDHFPLFEEFGISKAPYVRMNRVNLEGIDLAEVDPETAVPDDGTGEQLRTNWHIARDYYLKDRSGDGTVDPSPTLRQFFDTDVMRLYHRPRSPLPRPYPPTGFCQPGQRRLHVRTDGSFQPCERVGESLVIGDVEQGIDLEKVENLFSGLFGAVRHRCEDCWALRMCGICFTALAPKWSSEDPAATEVPPEYCEAVKANTEEAIRLFLDLKDRSPGALDFLEGSKMI